MRRAHWVRLAAAIALAALGDPLIAQDSKGEDPVRRQAEELAEEASKRFGEVLKEQAPVDKPQASAPANPEARGSSFPLLLYWLDYSEHEYRGIMRRLALEGTERGWDPATVSWLKRSRQDFQALMLRLARAGAPRRPWDPVAEAVERARTQSTAGGAPMAPLAQAPAAPPPSPAAVPGEGVASLPAQSGAGGPSQSTTVAEAASQSPAASAGAKAETELAAAQTPAPADRTAPGPPAARPQPAPLEPAPNAGETADPDPGRAPAATPSEGEARATPPAHAPDLAPPERRAPGRVAAAAPQEMAKPDQAAPAAAGAASDLGSAERVVPGPDSASASRANATAKIPPPAGPAETLGAAPALPATEPPAPPPQMQANQDGAATGAPRTSGQDRLAGAPGVPPGAVPAREPGASAAPSRRSERRGSKIAKPSEAKSHPRIGKGAIDRCQTAGATVPLPGWYVVKRGDTLWAIAERHYGAGTRYRTIFAANRARLKRGPDFILPCQQLFLPRQRRRGFD